MMTASSNELVRVSVTMPQIAALASRDELARGANDADGTVHQTDTTYAWRNTWPTSDADDAVRSMACRVHALCALGDNSQAMACNVHALHALHALGDSPRAMACNVHTKRALDDGSQAMACNMHALHVLGDNSQAMLACT